MAGLPWFALASDFPGHPKTVRLCKRLKDENAGMYIVRLFAHCATYAPEGRIAVDELAKAAGWSGRSHTFLAAALEVGFIESSGSHVVVHGWEERNGAHVRKHAKDSARPNANKRSEKEKNPARGLRGAQRGVSAEPRAGDNTNTDKESTEDLQAAAATDPLPVFCDAESGGGGLERICERLAKEQGLPRVGLGRNTALVSESFGRWLRLGGEEALVAECLRLAREKATGAVGHLTWWCRFLDTAPDSEIKKAGEHNGAAA